MNVWKFLVANKSHANGSQRLFRFPNGFGASVVKHSFSYGGDRGLYELAVLSWFSEESFSLEYQTPITYDVLGYMSVEEVESCLEDIMRLGVFLDASLCEDSI